MEPKERKPNRLRDYDYSQNGAYFVTICTYERQRTLSSVVGDGFPVPDILTSKVRLLPAYFRDSSTATARSTVIPTMGEQCEALRVEIHATCRWQVATLPMGRKNGHPDSDARLGFEKGNYFRDSSTATARSTVMPTMGEQCEALRVEIHATCRWQVATLPMGALAVTNRLFQRFFDCNCDGDSHTDHGVVTCAQEAHGKPPLSAS